MPEAELNNLARIGQLDKVPFSADLLRKMLATARTRLQDAQRTDNSVETRFDCAYTAIRAVADAALLAQGWRTATVRVLDALRKQRNLSDYDGELVTDQALHECLQQAAALIQLAEQQLQALTNKNTP